MPVNQLESWISLQIGLPRKTVLSRSALNKWQKQQLIKTVQYVRKNSPWYRKRLGDLSLAGDKDVSQLLQELPFSNAEDLREHSQDMLCSSQAEIKRIVTLNTSGTSAKPKRIFFTADDLDKTRMFFEHGMRLLIAAQDSILVLLPSQRENDVGSLLVQALQGAGHRAQPLWPAHDAGAVASVAESLKARCLVGMPQHILPLARESGLACRLAPFLNSVLLCSDYAAPCVRNAISQSLDCRVHMHYGSTESGLGGAVECEYGQGCHIRENDLLFEVIDPDSGDPVPEGREGELVFTTLTRIGMPLIRYRTGDLGRLTSKRCPCGSILSRLQNVQGRLENRVELSNGLILTLVDLDNILLNFSEVTAYEAELEYEEHGLSNPYKTEVLHLNLNTISHPCSNLVDSIYQVLQASPAIKQSLTCDNLKLKLSICKENPNKSHTLKRKLLDRR